MLIQIMIGIPLMMMSTMIVGLSALAILRVFNRHGTWLGRPPHDLKLVLAMMGVSVWIMFIITISVTIWATAFRLLGLFSTLEEAVYFSIVTFTTLGFGDLLLPVGWRILGGITAVNGLLNVALLTAIMIEALRDIGLRQRSKDG